MRNQRSTAARRRNGELTATNSGATSPFPADLKGRAILVAEDEILIAMEVQSALEDAGGRVVGPAHTVSQALELAASPGLSAAVLDLRLGSHSADRVARLLSQRRVPFVFYTGQTKLDPERAKWPDIATVSKPASGRALVKALASLFEQDPPSSRST